MDGYFYGAGQGGSSGSPATVFKVTADGALTILGTLAKAYPDGGLLQDTDGNLYGTTARGGKHSLGAIYRVSSDGSLGYTFSFNGSAGDGPQAGLTEGTNGKLYGTTASGGTRNGGVVFKYSPGGAEKVLYDFCTPNCADGGGPVAKLLQAADGNFMALPGERGSHLAPPAARSSESLPRGC